MLFSEIDKQDLLLIRCIASNKIYLKIDNNNYMQNAIRFNDMKIVDISYKRRFEIVSSLKDLILEIKDEVHRSFRGIEPNERFILTFDYIHFYFKIRPDKYNQQLMSIFPDVIISDAGDNWKPKIVGSLNDVIIERQ